MKNLGIYIHFPFCRKKCDYCTFYSLDSYENNSDVFKLYIKRLKSEIAEFFDKNTGYRVDTIYFGGGTPSMIEGDALNDLISLIKGSTNVEGNAEISIECNPADSTYEKIKLFTGAGVNRIVLGAQTLQPDAHQLIGRSGTVCSGDTMDIFFDRNYSFTRGVDMISGIPFPGSVEMETVGEIVMRRPEHISAYMLSIEEGSPLSLRLAKTEIIDSFQVEMFSRLADFLKSSGYIHYEISNFSLPGYFSRHNMKYWTWEEYAGFGPGAHSFVKGERFSNSADLSAYLNNEDTRDFESRNENSDVVEYLMLGLRLTDGIDLKIMAEKTGRELPDQVTGKIEKYVNEGLLRIVADPAGTKVCFTDAGIYLSDSVIFGLTEFLL